MELRSGYKKTEVGVIPEEWEVRKIAGVGPIQTGPFGTVLKASEYSVGDGVPLISVGEIKIGQIVLKEDTPRVDADVVRRLSRYVVRQGDILFGRKGAVDRSAPVHGHQDGWFLGSDGIRLRPTNSYNSAFLAYQFQTPPIRHWLLENSVGTTMPSLNERVLSQVAFACPPDNMEQEAIAEALSDVDASIAAMSRLIAKKRDLRQGAMQRLLTGQTRLPSFTAPWQEKRLGELGSWRGGMTPSMQIAHYWEGGSFPWLSSGDVKSPTLNDSGMHITEAAIVSKATTVVPAGSIVFVMRSGILRKYFPVALIERSMAINQDIKALTVAADYNPSFIRQMLHWRGDDVLQSCLKTGTTVESIDFGWLKAFELRLPSALEEQSAIAQALSDMDGEIAALEARLDKTRALKQAMMQALLTGRIRLPVRCSTEPLTKEVAHA